MHIYIYIVLDRIIITNNFLIYDKVISVLQTKFSPERLRAYLNIPDKEGNTALLYAAYRGNLEIILSLIENGSIVTVTTKKGLNVMHMAAQGDNPDIIIFFKEKYGMSIYSQDKNGSTPLHWACYSSSENVINYLLSFMDNINIQDKKGQTPLHIAIFTERIKIIKKLLYKGGDVNIKDNKGKNAITLARELTGSTSKITNLLLSNKTMKNFLYGNNNNFSWKNNPLTFIIIAIVYILIVYFFQLKYLASSIHTIILMFIFIAMMLVFIKLVFSNPGIIINRTKKKEWLTLVLDGDNLKNICPYCKVKRVQLGKHCFTCGHCVKEYGHHCNIIRNCIGEENRLIYLLFLGLFLMLIGYEYYISLKVFLINIPSIKSGRGGLILPFYFLYKKTFKDFIAVLLMTIEIFIFGIGAFLMFKQLRQMVIFHKIKNLH